MNVQIDLRINNTVIRDQFLWVSVHLYISGFLCLFGRFSIIELFEYVVYLTFCLHANF